MDRLLNSCPCETGRVLSACVHAKLLQLCSTLCDPVDCSPPGATWEAQQSTQIRSDQSFSHVRLFATPWIAARQASLSLTNSRSSLRLRGDPKAFGLPIQWLYPLMMAEKESRKDGMPQRCRTLFLAGGISNSSPASPTVSTILPF